jgi:acyl carrier protein
MTEQQIYAALTEILQDAFMRDDIVATPALSARDVAGWDSFKQIEIVLAAQERFQVKLRAREVDRLQNVGDLVDAIAGKLSAA